MSSSNRHHSPRCSSRNCPRAVRGHRIFRGSPRRQRQELCIHHNNHRHRIQSTLLSYFRKWYWLRNRAIRDTDIQMFQPRKLGHIFFHIAQLRHISRAQCIQSLDSYFGDCDSRHRTHICHCRDRFLPNNIDQRHNRWWDYKRDYHYSK